MAEHKGLLKICDRCDAQVFLKYKGTDTLDGGYTRVDDFEDAPAGWDYFQVGKVYRTLCPACTERWKEISAAFIEGRM